MLINIQEFQEEFQDEDASVWAFVQGERLRSTTEDRAVRLIDESPGFADYIFFFADLVTPEFADEPVMEEVVESEPPPEVIVEPEPEPQGVV